MIDRELLAKSAKAAGVKLLFDPAGDPRDCTGMHPTQNIYSAPLWNPLTDDGDALRLAVALNEFEPYRSNGGWRISPGENLESACRAIVRAAAEIGKAM